MEKKGIFIKLRTGLLLSLLLHLCIFLILKYTDKILVPTFSSPKHTNISLNLSTFSSQKIQKPSFQKASPQVKKPIKSEKVKSFTKVIAPKKKISKVKKSKTKTVKKRIRKKSKDKLANALMQNLGFNKSNKQKKKQVFRKNYKMKTIKKLYGSAFHRYTSKQKNFIKRNLGAIHQITQRTLIQNGYPHTAIQTKQQGVNIVSFYLHPNGDISKLMLKRAIGYTALDSNTLEVIRIAYQNYPRPKTKTRIIFYVKYSFY